MDEDGDGSLHQDMEGIEKPAVAKLSLKIHEVAKDCQNRNGLRHGDYHQYRQYCTRRLKRVRSSQQVRHMFGKGKTFVKKELTPDLVTTSSHLEIPLMTAERAWAYAMQRKQEAPDAPSSVRHHAVARFSKAAKWATDLEALCSETADERTCIEATAYSAWMSGNLLLEKGLWREALGRYSTAHRICEELGKVGMIEDQDLFSRRVEEIEPVMRYCRYNLGSGNDSPEGVAATQDQPVEVGRDGSFADADLLGERLASVIAEARKTQTRELGSVEWRGKKVSVRSEDVRVALIKADKLAQRLGHSTGEAFGVSLSPTVYQSVLGLYDDALSLIAKEASRLRGKGGSLKIEEHRAELEALRAYAQHHKLTLMVQRNERLVLELQEKRGPVAATEQGGERNLVGEVTDMIHVYDALLQGARDILTNLGGGDNIDDDIAEEEDELAESARADEARFRAFRCFYVIEAFLAQEKWAEASALFSHTRGLCQEAADLLGNDPRADSLKSLDEMVKGAWHRTAAHALLLKARQEAGLAAGVKRITIGGGGGRGDWVSIGRPLQERLGEFGSTVSGRDAGSRKTRTYRIADFPPSLQLLPCKPRLLDLAFEELEFPDLDERAGVEKKALEDEDAKAAAASRSTGISGWVGWALGR